MFGTIAIEKGYISEEQLQRALQYQQKLREDSGSHKLIGLIMLEMNMISSEQLLEILREIESNQNIRYY